MAGRRLVVMYNNPTQSFFKGLRLRSSRSGRHGGLVTKLAAKRPRFPSLKSRLRSSPTDQGGYRVVLFLFDLAELAHYNKTAPCLRNRTVRVTDNADQFPIPSKWHPDGRLAECLRDSLRHGGPLPSICLYPPNADEIDPE